MNLTDLVIQSVFWALGFLFLFRIPRCGRSKAKNRLYPSLSIIIPARNEENSLPILLASIRSQSFTPDETIVVVSQSDDRTSEIAQRDGATTIQSGPLPEGWLGKPWACHQGATIARGEILVFLDADTSIEDGGLKNIVETCLERDGVVSIEPYHKTRKLYEQLSAFFNIIMMGAMGAFTVIGNRIKPIGLFGPCIAIRRQQYFESGGHREVRAEVVEDLALGERLKRQTIPIYCYGGQGTISFRMYPNGIGELIDGWSKGFGTGATKTYIPILLAIIAWIGGGINATRYLTETLFDASAPSILVWLSAYLCYAAQIYWMLFRLGTFKIHTALFYPVSLLFFLAVFLRSLFLIFIRRRVTWKGATISLKDEAPKR